MTASGIMWLIQASIISILLILLAHHFIDMVFAYVFPPSPEIKHTIQNGGIVDMRSRVAPTIPSYAKCDLKSELIQYVKGL